METEKRNYFQWLKHQLQGWGVANYAVFFTALGSQLMALFQSSFTLISIVTFIGTMLGVACVVSINAVKPINGVLGILSALALIYVGYSAKNYLSIAEQIAYVATLDLPILIGGRYKWNDNTVNEIRTFGVKQWIESLTFTALMFVGSSFLIQYYTAEPRPFIDGLSFSICLTAGIICWRKYNNQYFWWLASGLVQVALWLVTYLQGGASLAMFVSCSIYVVNDIVAFVASPWFKRNRVETTK